MEDTVTYVIQLYDKEHDLIYYTDVIRTFDFVYEAMKSLNEVSFHSFHS